MSANVFKAYLSVKLDAGGSETTVSLDRVTTLTDETISTSLFTTLGRGILTVNPDGDGEISYPEYISFTTVTGSTVTGAIRGLSALSNSVVTANKRFHPVGTPVVISFGVHDIQDIIDYVDEEVAALAIGTANVVLATAGETVTAGQLVYLKNDGKWWLADADTLTTVDGVQLGLAQGDGAADGSITGGVMKQGLDTHQSGLVAGTTYFASNTAGGLSTTAGTNSKAVGVARSATSIYFDPNFTYALTPKVVQTYTPSAAGTATLNLSLGNIHHITMPAGDITIAITGGTVGQCFIVRILQDGVGSRTVTWFSTIRWAGGSAPTLTTTLNKVDTLGFEVTAVGSTYDGFIVGQNI